MSNNDGTDVPNPSSHSGPVPEETDYDRAFPSEPETLEEPEGSDGSDWYDDEEELNRRGAENENDTVPDNRKDVEGKGSGLASVGSNLAKKQLEGTAAGDAVEKVEQVEKAANVFKTILADGKAVFAFFSKVLAILLHPVSLIIMGILLLVTIIIVTTLSYTQVLGTARSEQSGATGASVTTQRLAQRAVWLMENHLEYGVSVGPLLSKVPGGAPGHENNAWNVACPNIVYIIYGASPYLSGYMGHSNAKLNYEAHPEMYQAYAFNDGRASAGASLQNPPAGAIVSMTLYDAGHTFVMLTDELVIDNMKNGGIRSISSPAGPRKLTAADRGAILGWALPVAEGFEGKFITGDFVGAADSSPAQEAMPGLKPPPEWVGTADATGGSASGQNEKWMSAAGISQSDWAYVDYIVTHESSWNPKATNASSGACGLVQILPCSKAGGDGYDPVVNLKWANTYAKDSYGSWKGAYDFWKANQWW